MGKLSNEEETAKRQIMDFLEPYPNDVRIRALARVEQMFIDKKRAGTPGTSDDGLHPVDALKAALPMSWSDTGSPIPKTAWASDAEANRSARDHFMLNWHKGGYRLQSAHGSKLYKLRRCIRERVAAKDLHENVFLEMTREAQSFVVQHDWAAAFANAGDFDGQDYKLPATICAFEFRINDAHIIAIISEEILDHIHGKTLILPFVELPIKDVWGMWCGTYRIENGRWLRDSETWIQGDPDCYDELAALVGAQIKAVCVALDAEAAETEVVHAPHKLVRAREKEGRLPPNDYHVVNLCHRVRARDLEHGEPSGRKVRLHFRRGHWRHYPTRKTWIKWVLVGNPDLGFIDKHYKL